MSAEYKGTATTVLSVTENSLGDFILSIRRPVNCNKQYFRSYREHFMASPFGILFYVTLELCCTNHWLNTTVTNDLFKRFSGSIGLLYLCGTFRTSRTILYVRHSYILNWLIGRPTSVLVELCSEQMNFILFLHCMVRFMLFSTVFHVWNVHCITALERRRVK
jgi:hypothetical protein